MNLPAASQYLSSLSPNATSSLKDFEMQLGFLGTDVLDEKAFNDLLNNIGYRRSREGLWDSFLVEVASITKNDVGIKDSSSFITAADMAKLYASEAYHLLDNGKDSGDALMEYVNELFNQANTNIHGQDDSVLDKDEFRSFFRKVMNDRYSDEAADEAFEAIDADGSGEITISEFKEDILKSNKNKISGMPRTFNYNLFSPTLTSAGDFVKALERHAKNHRACTHHLLENIACATFGTKETANIILLFLSAYNKFNSGFVERLQTLINLLDSPKHREIVRENVREEMGFYSEDTLEEAASLGISRKSIEYIPHHQLFRELVKTVEAKLKCSYLDFIPEDLSEEMVAAQKECEAKGKIGLLGSIYFGSELIVPSIYSALLVGIRSSLNLSHEETRFLLLHISMDEHHADNIRDIIVSHCKTAEDRVEFVKCTELIINARVSFYDKLCSLQNHHTFHNEASQLYNRQASKWPRDEPRCLFDFTERPVIYDFISGHIYKAAVLDVGCGEGCMSRRMAAMGAEKVVGIDISPDKIDDAKSHEKKGQNEYFLVGDAARLKQELIDNSAECNLMLGANFDTGTFDLSVAVFLFNFMSITAMNETFENVYSLLKPGGHFVFSVPHPFMASRSSAAFGFQGSDHKSSYFSMRDKCIEGHIGTIDGEKLNVNKMIRKLTPFFVPTQNAFKTIEDYLNAATSQGFEIVEFTEARVSAEDMANNAPFFSNVNGYPLHLVIKIRKPQDTNDGAALGSMNTLDLLPKKLNWPRTVTNNVENSLVMLIPKDVNTELIAAAIQVYEKGILVDDLDIGKDIDLPTMSRPRSRNSRSRGRCNLFSTTKEFAKRIRSRLLHETGAVIVKGLDMAALSGVDQLDKMTVCSKIAYFILGEHIGTVDATARGKLFDVKSANIDAMSKSNDNVLFSVSDTEAGWHTDGASKDRVYDVVSLLCISPAAEGGKFRISNACNVYDELNRTLPKFLLYELTRPIPRDILENGGGKGTAGAATALSRSPAILAMRIKYNSYPIYLVEGARMRFRYMRHWIETGHEKTYWKVPNLLKIAMDVLDDHLDDACCFHQALERGDMIFANNAMLAHARDQFKNDPDGPPRHKVRAWIQVQKAAILNDEHSFASSNENKNTSILNGIKSLSLRCVVDSEA